MRPKQLAKLEGIIAAATDIFIEHGYGRAKVHQIAERAGVGPGTIYLYAEDKEALFELAMLRALESPIVAHPRLPYRKTKPDGRHGLIGECLHEISHFPQLWLGTQRRQLDNSREEYLGILLEIARWLRRYRNAVLLAERNRLDWPELMQSFQSLIWADLHKRLIAYLAVRVRAGQLVALGDPLVIARFTLDAMIAYLVTGPLEPSIGVPENDDLLVRLVGGAVIGSGDHLPLAT